MPEGVQKAIAAVKPTLSYSLPVILVAVLVSSISCSGHAPVTSSEPIVPSYVDIAPEEAYELIRQQEVVMLDVRTQEEYDSGHIPDSLLIPLFELESRLGEVSPADCILTYCCSGCHGGEAASILVANGFLHVYNIEGGIIQWQDQGFPITLTYTDVTPEEAYEIISQQEVVILDVRMQEEYNSGHIADAVLIPLAELESRLDELNSADRILIYCRSGHPSQEAASTLVANSFIHVYNLDGGITQWQAQGFPITLTYTDVTPEEAHELISQQEVVILDVRTQEEYDSGHIPDSLLIPLSELESRLGGLNPADCILIYCHSGHRSREAASTLVANAFIHVYNIEGGIIQWQARGFPITLTYTDVTPEEASEMISQQEVVVIDLRTRGTYDRGHIPDALLIPLSEFESRLGELNTTDNILVYHSCGSCSREAAQFLIDNGFLHIYNLQGGIDQWQAQGFPVTRKRT